MTKSLRTEQKIHAAGFAYSCVVASCAFLYCGHVAMAEEVKALPPPVEIPEDVKGALKKVEDYITENGSSKVELVDRVHVRWGGGYRICIFE